MAERKDGGDPRRELELEPDSGGPALELERPVAPPRALPVEPAAPPRPADGPAPPYRAARPVEKTFDAPPVASFSLSAGSKIGIAVAVLLVAAVLVRYGMRHRTSEIEAIEARGGVYRLTDHVLADEYFKNRSRADRAYAGHRVQIAGRFAKMRLDFGGQNAVQLLGNGGLLIDAVMRPDAWTEVNARGVSGLGPLLVECVVRGVTDEYVRVDDCSLPEGVP